MHNVETARLLLRPFTLADADAYYEVVMRDPEVQRYLPAGAPLPYDRALPYMQYFTNHYAQHDFGIWAVIRKDNARLIGHCGLEYIPDRDHVVEIAYALARDAWGMGFATEAAHAALRYGFETLELPRIIALFMPENKGSEHVMIKLGMKAAGTMFAFGRDLPHYVMTGDQFEPGSAPYSVMPVG